MLWSGLGMLMALSLPETPVRQDAEPGVQAMGAGGLPGLGQMPGIPDPARPPGF